MLDNVQRLARGAYQAALAAFGADVVVMGLRPDNRRVVITVKAVVNTITDTRETIDPLAPMAGAEYAVLIGKDEWQECTPPQAGDTITTRHLPRLHVMSVTPRHFGWQLQTVTKGEGSGCDQYTF